MEFEGYLQEIEALVVHLAPEARVLSDMDLHVAERLFEEGVPLEVALAGIRKGARRLQRLKKPPRGLPLSRVRRDVDKESKRLARRRGAAPEAHAEAAGEAPAEGAEPGARWRAVVRRLADEVEPPTRDELVALADDAALGEERGFVRFTRISGAFYSEHLERLEPATRQAWRDEVRRATADATAAMSEDARQELLEELVRRRLIAENPVLDPGRFWEEA